MVAEAGPLEWPDRWVNADPSPSWEALDGTLVALVGWRLDRWSTLERLHRLDRAVRSAERRALAVGLHGPGVAGVGPDDVRDALLARGTWAPCGLLAGDEAPLDPGEVVLAREGAIAESFGSDVAVEAIADRVAELAEPGSVDWRPRGAASGPWPLAFPADVAVGGSRIAVADQGHNRVLVARPGGEILHIVGDGVPGDRDGSLAEARFEAPRGVCWRGDELLVADTSNDAIRSVKLAADEVVTLARAPEGSLPGGLASVDGEILAALPGQGSLARLDGGELVPLGEPSADEDHPVDVVAWGDRWLVSEPQAAQLVVVDEDGRREGIWEGQPLARPGGLVTDERVIVADPGAGSLVELDPEAERGRRLADPAAGLAAPSAVDREADRLVVADGGGHHLWRVDPEGGDDPTRMRLTEPPLALAEHIRLDPIEIAPAGRVELSIVYLARSDDPRLPADPQAPTVRGPVRGLAPEGAPDEEGGRLRVEMAGRVAASGNVRVRWNLTGEDVGHEAAWDLPIVVRPGADERLRLALSTSPP
jgi:hypothetical protein